MSHCWLKIYEEGACAFLNHYYARLSGKFFSRLYVKQLRRNLDPQTPPIMFKYEFPLFDCPRTSTLRRPKFVYTVHLK